MEGVTQWLFKVVEKMSPFTGCHYCYLVTQDGVLDTRAVVTQSMSGCCHRVRVKVFFCWNRVSDHGEEEEKMQKVIV